jgi:DNA-binding PadR family transcriptional regulator
MRTNENPGSGAISVTTTMLNILVVLAGGQKHGYAILREIRELNDVGARLGATSLYRSIRNLLQAGLIEELSDSPTAIDDERRRYYRLTTIGMGALNDEIQRIERVLKIVKGHDLKPVTGGRP